MQREFTMALTTRQILSDHPDALRRSDAVEPPASYAAYRIARRARISTAQASVIVELLGLAPELRHD
jgi:hypothetical protein